MIACYISFESHVFLMSSLVHNNVFNVHVLKAPVKYLFF